MFVSEIIFFVLQLITPLRILVFGKFNNSELVYMKIFFLIKNIKQPPSTRNAHAKRLDI